MFQGHHGPLVSFCLFAVVIFAPKGWPITNESSVSVCLTTKGNFVKESAMFVLKNES